MRALIISANDFEDSELLFPYYRLMEEEAGVDIASIHSGRITGKHGYSVDVNLTFDKVNPNEYDLLIIPGGKAPEAVRLNKDALRICKHFFDTNKTVASICHGVQVLISAGLMRGRRATCWQGIKDDLIAAGAHYLDKDVVVDGVLISSRQPGDLPAFCREIMKRVRAEVYV